MTETLVIDEQVNSMLAKSTAQHKKISSLKTPSAYVKQKMGMDYVELSYMKELADKYYPGWSWLVVNTEFAGTEAFVVHGRLAFIDNGIRRTGDMTAAHRIQKNKEGVYVDIGNDIKAANTDCMKKAFNTYMNIADDVYRNQNIFLDDDQEADLINLMHDAGMDMNDIDDRVVQIRKGKINIKNLDKMIVWIKEQKKQKKAGK